MPYMQTTNEFWDEIADGTFAKVLHTVLCEQSVEATAAKVDKCKCRERFREALPGRYAKAASNDILFTDVPELALTSVAVAEGAEDDTPQDDAAQSDAPQEETVAQRKRREKAEAEAAS